MSCSCPVSVVPAWVSGMSWLSIAALMWFGVDPRIWKWLVYRCAMVVLGVPLVVYWVLEWFIVSPACSMWRLTISLAWLARSVGMVMYKSSRYAYVRLVVCCCCCCCCCCCVVVVVLCWISCWMSWWIAVMVDCSASEKTAAESAQPCVVPTLVVLVWIWSSLSVQRVVVGRPYQVDVSLLRGSHSMVVALMMDSRGIVV